jgi:orotate phosphoribosyltransferase
MKGSIHINRYLISKEEERDMLSNDRIIEIFRKSEVLMEGHFLLTSGRHSSQYMQCARVFQYPVWTEELSGVLTEEMSGLDIDIVIGPAIGGIILSYEMGRRLGVKTIFAERENGAMTLRRGFEIQAGARVLVVEDVVTTGGSVMEVMELVRGMGANVAGVGAFVDRSNGKVDFGVPFFSVLSLEVKSYAPEECPLCKKHIPVVKPGSRNTRA